jgi:hypothetical protein
MIPKITYTGQDKTTLVMANDRSLRPHKERITIITLMQYNPSLTREEMHHKNIKIKIKGGKFDYHLVVIQTFFINC